MEKIKTLIVDDHKIVRNGLKIMLESKNKKYKFIVEEAEDAEEAIQKVREKNFNIVIMDYKLPGLNGAEATKKILLFNQNIKILALSNYDEYICITNMLEAGAHGFVLKNIGYEELISAITTILSGNTYYSNEVALKLIE